MKKIIAILLLASVLSGCTSSTEFGECVGLFDEKNPKLTYKLSGWNAFVAVIGSGLMFIPTIMVVANETFCPVGKR